MRIIQINSVYGHGSTGRIVKSLHEELMNKNHKSYVFYGRGKKHSDENIQRISNQLDWNYHGLITRFFDSHGLASKNVTRNMISKIKSIKPDIIHLHNIHGYYLNYPILFDFLKYNFNGKIIWTMHDCWAFTGHCSYYSYVGCDKWETHCNNCPQINKYPKSYFIDNSFRNFDKKNKYFTGLSNLRIITPSIWLKEDIQKSFLKDYTIDVVNNGIDKNIFKMTKSDFKDQYGLKDKFIILGVANIWEERKGLNYFVELSKLISPEMRIIIVGKSQENLALYKNIIHIPQTNNAIELAKLYSIADVYLNPSKEDNYPNTNLEALACDTPIITSNIGGNSEVTREASCVVINKLNTEKIYAEIKNIKSNINKYRSLKFNMFVDSTSEMALKYIDIYFENI